VISVSSVAVRSSLAARALQGSRKRPPPGAPAPPTSCPRPARAPLAGREKSSSSPVRLLANMEPSMTAPKGQRTAPGGVGARESPVGWDLTSTVTSPWAIASPPLLGQQALPERLRRHPLDAAGGEDEVLAADGLGLRGVRPDRVARARA